MVDDTASKLIAMARHYGLPCYSYEWQTLWTNDLNENRNMDYVVSYIYNKEERENRRDELQHLFLRLMSRQEIERVIAQASSRTGVGWLITGLPREYVIEPQLGYALRFLVTRMQRGQRFAYGLVGIFEVKKK
jgi:hypothetical protein